MADVPSHFRRAPQPYFHRSGDTPPPLNAKLNLADVYKHPMYTNIYYTNVDVTTHVLTATPCGEVHSDGKRYIWCLDCGGWASEGYVTFKLKYPCNCDFLNKYAKFTVKRLREGREPHTPKQPRC